MCQSILMKYVLEPLIMLSNYFSLEFIFSALQKRKKSLSSYIDMYSFFQELLPTSTKNSKTT